MPLRRRVVVVRNSKRRKAADAAVALGARWSVERLLWIAIRTNLAAACPISQLPPELVRPVMTSLMLFEVTPDDALETIEDKFMRHG